MADKKQTMLYGLLTSIASKITYDNTESGLTADNVQDAIDEVNDKISLYSTSEVEIGIFNGKKVFRKTLTGSNTDAYEVAGSRYQRRFLLMSGIDNLLEGSGFYVNYSTTYPSGTVLGTIPSTNAHTNLSIQITTYFQVTPNGEIYFVQHGTEPFVGYRTDYTVVLTYTKS